MNSSKLRFTIQEIVDSYGNQLNFQEKEALRKHLEAEKAKQVEEMNWWQKLIFFLKPIFNEVLVVLAEAFINKNKK